MNLTPDRLVHEVRPRGGRGDALHPHGDSAIYEAMVRLAQPFAMRLPLVDGHGNFGSLDDGPAASPLYRGSTRPGSSRHERDIDEDTVDFTPNYDNKLKEPTVLLAAIPNLLVNLWFGHRRRHGHHLATHNSRRSGECRHSSSWLTRMPHLEQLMRKHVPGPDWPTGGTIIGRDGIQ